MGGERPRKQLRFLRSFENKIQKIVRKGSILDEPGQLGGSFKPHD